MTNNQYKFHIVDKGIIIAKLKDLNISLSCPITNLYTYFDPPKKIEGTFASLRIIESKSKNYIDMKTRDEFQKWQRVKSSIDKPEEVKAILKEIGCKTSGIFYKVRQSFENEYVHIDLDEIENVGNFLEVKFDDKVRDKIEALISSIGIDPNTHDTRSLMEIYLEKKNGTKNQ
jgi:predicted adenylyl cyclase CyaB